MDGLLCFRRVNFALQFIASLHIVNTKVNKDVNTFAISKQNDPIIYLTIHTSMYNVYVCLIEDMYLTCTVHIQGGRLFYERAYYFNKLIEMLCK